MMVGSGPVQWAMMRYSALKNCDEVKKNCGTVWWFQRYCGEVYGAVQ